MCLGWDLNPQGCYPQHFKCCMFADFITEACVRRGRELHPRMRVLQTLALLLGHHAQSQRNNNKIIRFFQYPPSLS